MKYIIIYLLENFYYLEEYKFRKQIKHLTQNVYNLAKAE